ncbi:MAG: Anaphase-promoting complex subunit 23 [Alyxoria varia]|nr:MAG: Anaphase-promoting complex subunit 23 [Alyxoria varia]
MSSLNARDNAQLRQILQDAVVKCSERCLYQSAKWAAELVNSLPPSAEADAETEVDSPMSDADTKYPPGIISQNEDVHEAKLEAAEAQKYLLAKTYFDCREYDRCAAVFLPMKLPKGQLRPSDPSTKSAKPQNSSNVRSTEKAEGASASSVYSNTGELPNLSERSLFLALYAKYMSGEKRKDEDSEMILGPVDGGVTINKELMGIARLLKDRIEELKRAGRCQGWLEYLYGIVLAKMKNVDEAKHFLIRSVSSFAWNWGAWQELGALIGSTDELSAAQDQLPQNIMSFIFRIVQRQELFQGDSETLTHLKQIKGVFPDSHFLKTQKAMLTYHAKDFEKAERTFAKIVESDPLRLEDLDIYSNILYVMEKRPKLAYLAQLTTATDKFRPETCCVVGNYYAMKSEHEKAVMYFRRALTLDRNFLSAWTLMGHEYVEMKNTQAAIECYRRAVDINRKDYRAWYGLGQTYEVLEMHFYALFYYERAAALSPYDPKMWTAVGACLGKMQRPAQAVKAYKRALVAGSYYESTGSSFGSGSQGGGGNLRGDRPTGQSTVVLDPDVLYSLAQMHHHMGNEEDTKMYLEMVIAQEEGAVPDGEDEDTSMFKTSTGTTSGASPSSSAGVGVGVTATTSKARLWLVKMEITAATAAQREQQVQQQASGKSPQRSGGPQGADSAGAHLRRALQLANELCQDGWEVEEAKSLVREIRARLEVEGRIDEEEEGGGVG